MGQYGPVSLLAGGTNNVNTNGVWRPASTTQIVLGRYKEVGLHFEIRTAAGDVTNNSVWAWKRSLDGMSTDSNVWLLLTVPYTGTSTNLWITNVSLPPVSSLRLAWISNQNMVAYGTNCLTNLTLKYLLRE